MVSKSEHPDYTHVIDSLMTRFDGAFTKEQVQARVDDARGELEPQSRIPDFLGVLVERRARDLLERARE
jgi:hypothetical protein